MIEGASDINENRPAGTEVYLGLGANIRNPAETLQAAFEVLRTGVLEDAVMSSLYITEPMDVKDQPEFVNAVCRGRFSGSPLQLLARIHEIEGAYGRNREQEIRRGPRPLDIDILLFGKEVINDPPVLIVPHERLRQRQFALVPLLELSPELTDPADGSSYKDVSASITDQWIELLAN